MEIGLNDTEERREEQRTTGIRFVVDALAPFSLEYEEH